MSDPTGTSGAPHADRDMSAAFSGGTSFLARMEQLSAAKEAHDRAFLNLQLGQTAQEAHTQASKLHNEARAAHADAKSVQDKAEVKAATIVSQARAQAQRLISEAEENAKAAREEAERILTAARKQADEMVEAAGKIEAEAIAMRDRQEEIGKAYTRGMDDLAWAQKEAKTTKEDAVRISKVMRDAADILQKALNEIA